MDGQRFPGRQHGPADDHGLVAAASAREHRRAHRGATFDVLDVDVRASGNGWDALEQLKASGLVDGWHRAIRTPSGGLHLHYPGTDQRNGSLGGRHVDFRSQGGYVLLPPSLGQTKHYSRRYALIEQRTTGARPFDWQAARDLLSPPRVETSVDRAARSPTSIEQLVAHVRRQREGNRNNVLYWAANRALERGVADLEPLVRAAVAAGLPVHEAQRTVDSAARRTGQGQPLRLVKDGPGSRVPRSWSDDDGSVTSVAVADPVAHAEVRSALDHS